MVRTMVQRHGDILPTDGGPGLRVSDAEREQAVDLLSEHAAQGRLGVEELDARIETALAARTRGELLALTSDLPADPDGGHSTATRPRASRRALPLVSGQLAGFVTVNLVLVMVWALTGGGYFWPAWPILGWGLALAKGGACVLPTGRSRPSALRAPRA